MRRLYHYCCHHAAPYIDRMGVLVPSPVSWQRYDELLRRDGEPVSGLGARRGVPTLLWLTDMESPDREALGLTRHNIACDRTRFRYTVDAAGAVPWATFCARWRPNPEWRALLEDGRAPSRWFVATRPVRVVARVDRWARTERAPQWLAVGVRA